jgi:hypothetical protein
MMGYSSGLPFGWDLAGILVGYLFSLILFSFLLRESFLVRLGLYLLVGVSLGYAAVLAWHDILLPRLFRPLWEMEWSQVGADLSATSPVWQLLLPMLMGLLVWLMGARLMIRQGIGSPASGDGPQDRLLAWLLPLPLSLMVGTGLGTALSGSIQGTLIPQAVAATQVSPGSGGVLAGLALIITTGALLYLRVPEAGALGLPGPVAWLVRVWAWIGQRALWLAAGILFGQLILSRTTLLVERLLYFIHALPNSGLWGWLAALWGGGA